MTDEAKAVGPTKEIAKRLLMYFEADEEMAYEANAMMFGHELARSFLALSEKYRVLKNVAKSGLPNMRCDRWLGHQDHVCPKCVLQYALDELEPGDSE